ncbi:putative integral membrane protein [Babesia bovis T2Bo]|uniref:Uncharacterized protein n=1 Tax=Babesia bovis TaxID=5865 RepID=A7AVI1_BABBO|nr:putative integral membrane protein [Babesia bovis T2Bo]EDO05807.1 putative integral membrane protein [Babesia bovis T2Bo]|eukprot:XP_001609375.1 hypothetical protein [Babesia bovis T2Bo]
MALSVTKTLRICRISPLVGFKPGAGVVYHPSVEEAFHNDRVRQKRAMQKGYELPKIEGQPLYNGLDSSKTVENEWESINKRRYPMTGGYDRFCYRLPQVNAFTEDELVKFFDAKDYLNRFSLSEIWRSGKHRLTCILGIYLGFLAPFIFVWAEGLWRNRLEPMEPAIPLDDYFKHYVWHQVGHKIDHHAYQQYCEARRTNKWRNPDINPEDYIPPEFRNLQSFDGIKL